MTPYETWEAKLGMALADAERHLSVADYVKLCDWLADIAAAERDLSQARADGVVFFDADGEVD